MRKLFVIALFFLGIPVQQLSAQEPFVNFKVDPSVRYDTVKQIWGGLVWFYPFFALNLQGEPNTWYRETQPFVNRVIIITATGGRPDYPDWEILRKDDNGNLYYDFSMYDSCLDATLSLGYLPTINFMAIPLVLGSENPHISIFGWIKDPPTDYNEWYKFSKKVMSHTVERYGAGRVSTWRWRLGGEPDNPDAWSGTKEEYFKLYDYWTDALRSALPTAQVGPGNMLGDIENHWGIKILDHVYNETNFYTGKIGSPISFFTFSAYENCEKEFPPMSAFQNRIQTIKNKLQQYNALDSVAIGTDEGQLMLDENKAYLWGGDGTEYGAAWQAAYQTFGIRNGLKWMFQWNFTSDGVKDPKYNVIEMLEKMKGEVRVSMENVQDTRDDITKMLNAIDGIASVNDTARNLKILLFNHYKYRDKGFGFFDSMLVHIRIDKLPFNTDKVYIRHWIVDKNHSNFFTEWLKDSKDIPRVDRGGWPSSLYDAEVTGVLDQDGKNFWYAHKDKYLKIDDLDTTGPDITQPVPNDGSLSFNIYIHPQEVSLLEVSADPIQTGIRGISFSGKENEFHLSVYPNPFNYQTHILFTLEKPSMAKLEIYNMLGKKITTLINENLGTGNHEVVWNRIDNHNAKVPPGIYFFRLLANHHSVIKKMIRIK